MQRVPTALAKSAGLALESSLVPTPTVPHSEARGGIPTEWNWTEARPARTTTPAAATFTPQGYEENYAYPLLVWLHDDGCDERCLPRLMPHVSLRNFVAAAPRGATRLEDGFGWRQSLGSIDASIEAVAGAIETARRRFNYRSDRVFIAGAGTGGTMAMRVALQHPDWFAGVATLDGPLPRGHRPLSRVNDLRRLPLLLSAGRESIRYPEAAVCQDLSLLHATGCRVAIRQYPGSDDLTTAMLADLNRWAMDLVCGDAESATA